MTTSHSQAEHSASQFGIKLRRVGGDKSNSDEKIDSIGRKSVPFGVPSHCETRASQRRSTGPPNPQVAQRQGKAEKQAIERQKKCGSGSHSWGKQSKPFVPPKPILKSTSLGNIPKSANYGLKKPFGAQHKSPLSNPATLNQQQECDKKVTVNTDKAASGTDSWLNSFYGFYNAYKPVLDVLCLRVSDAANRQAMIIQKLYLEYERVFNKEARSWRNMRLRRRACHGHRFFAVGVAEASWCDLCTGVVWGRSTICLQCIREQLLETIADYRTPRSVHIPTCRKPIMTESRAPTCDVCSNGVNTDSQELLSRILHSMSHSSTHEQHLEDESDYANLWDSESGASSTAFQTNKDIMGSLMREKVGCQTSQGDVRRNAWISTSEISERASDSPQHFNLDKFKSLQEKAENMDLTLTDFFTDLKHGTSILELSKIFPSQKLSPSDCKFKCHQSCEDLIVEQCCGPKVASHHKSRRSHSKLSLDVDDGDSGYSGSGGSAGFTLTKEEICSMIHKYNKDVVCASGAMTLPCNESDSFQGCIKVCVCITRPINMSLSSRPASIYEILHREAELSPQTSPINTVITSGQLPQNAMVSLHTDSSNTANEVVSILLNKFKITDNPKSFALFEQTIKNEKEVKLRKVGDQERPLLNYLRWITEHNESKRFVLKENDSGDIIYEAFSIPELNNFLRVLEQEEAVRLTEIQKKYLVRRKQMADRLNELVLQRDLPKYKVAR